MHFLESDSEEASNQNLKQYLAFNNPNGNKLLKGILKSKFNIGYKNEYTINPPVQPKPKDQDKIRRSWAENLLGESLNSTKFGQNGSVQQEPPSWSSTKYFFPGGTKHSSSLTAGKTIQDSRPSNSQKSCILYSTDHFNHPYRERDSFENNYFYEDSTSPISFTSIESSNSSGGGGKNCHSNYMGRALPSSSKSRVIRILQLFSFVLIILGLITLVISSLYQAVIQTSEITSSSRVQHLQVKENLYSALESWLNPQTSLSGSSSDFRMSPILRDMPNFLTQLDNESICKQKSSNITSQEVYFLILIHSAPDHFIERQAIRTTWGSIRSYQNSTFRLVFLLGQQIRPTTKVQDNIFIESQLFKDIVQFNFSDSYRNLTFKHLSGYKWALSRCPNTKFILKADDDAFVDIFQLYHFTQRNFHMNGHPKNILLCNVYEGTNPVRRSDGTEISTYNKWIVSSMEYPYDVYPSYCGGLGYLITPDVASRILGLSRTLNKYLWIDDVFVTGILRELTNDNMYKLNVRYSYKEKEYQAWLSDNYNHKIPFIFVHVGRGRNYSEDMSRLWRKTLRAWSFYK